MKLLIVEDEEVLVRVLREKFEKLGVQVYTVLEGSGAFEAVKKFNPDMILLDIVLPNKDGFEVLSELKADRQVQNIPVIIMSNIEEDDRVRDALKMGAIDYIMKVQHPINEIVEKVMRYSISAK
jgi:DNA-binding response OmpR family regulator